MSAETLKTQSKSLFYIEKLERKVENWLELEEDGINRTIYLAYRKSKEDHLKFIDFSDVIWPDDVVAIVATLKENDIGEFTISCKFCDLIERLAAFEKLGCKVKSTTKIKPSWTGSTQRKITALKMKIRSQVRANN